MKLSRKGINEALAKLECLSQDLVLSTEQQVAIRFIREVLQAGLPVIDAVQMLTKQVAKISV